MGGLHDMGRVIGRDEKEGEQVGKVIMMLRFDVIIVVVLNYSLRCQATRMCTINSLLLIPSNI